MFKLLIFSLIVFDGVDVLGLVFADLNPGGGYNGVFPSGFHGKVNG